MQLCEGKKSDKKGRVLGTIEARRNKERSRGAAKGIIGRCGIVERIGSRKRLLRTINEIQSRIWTYDSR